MSDRHTADHLREMPKTALESILAVAEVRIAALEQEVERLKAEVRCGSEEEVEELYGNLVTEIATLRADRKALAAAIESADRNGLFEGWRKRFLDDIWRADRILREDK